MTEDDPEPAKEAALPWWARPSRARMFFALVFIAMGAVLIIGGMILD